MGATQKMTKQELFDYFGGQISMSCIKKGVGGYEVAGKFCRVQVFDDGTLDLWLVGYPNLKPLGTRWLTEREGDLKYLGLPLTRLDGELWVQGEGSLKSWILGNLSKLGLRKYSKAKAEAMKNVLSRHKNPSCEAR